MPVKALMSQLPHRTGCFTCISLQLFGIFTTKPNPTCSRGHGEGPHMQTQLVGADPGTAWSSCPWMWPSSEQTFSAKRELFQDTGSSKASASTYFAVPKGGPLSHRPVLGSFPVTTAFTSSLLEGFLISGHPQKPSTASPNSSNIWVFWKLPSSSVCRVLLGFLSLASAQLQQR